MKTIFTLILGLAITTASFANNTEPAAPQDAPRMSVVMAGSNMVRVRVNQQATSALVTVMDEDGNLIYSDNKHLEQGLNENIDLTELAPGVYQLAVSAGNGLVTKTVLITAKRSEKFVAFLH